MSGRAMEALTMGPRRRRRHMAKRLAELDTLDRLGQLTRPDRFDSVDQRLERLKREASLRPPTRQAPLRWPPKRKTHRIRSTFVVLLLLAGGAGVFVVTRHHSGHASVTAGSHSLVTAGSSSPVPAASQHADLGGDSSTSAERVEHLAGKVPSPGVGEQKSRILPAVVGPAGTGGYLILPEVAKFAARYDPCRPIHFVIRDQHTPAGGDAAIRKAVNAVSHATGLKFVDDGTTTETPNEKREPYQPTRYGDRWAPVVIAWTSPSEIPGLKGLPMGLGGSNIESAPGRGRVLVTGSIWIDTPEVNVATANYPDKPIIRALIEHELGHVIGLGHVNDKTQLMYADDLGLSGYGTGDLRGLAALGTGACHPDI